jgi:hypothetical protein
MLPHIQDAQEGIFHGNAGRPCDDDEQLIVNLTFFSNGLEFSVLF